ncbi:hypothetical protein D920_00865 [Enterococcus faecalis 13-SD-W-01]|nr:hypothetical protein D920_00865 [Enterococcus faecalis 13-SD-W-01]
MNSKKYSDFTYYYAHIFYPPLEEAGVLVFSGNRYLLRPERNLLHKKFFSVK